MIIPISILISTPYIYKSIECIYGLFLLKKENINTEKSTNKYDISVIVAFKNEEKNLPKLIDSLIKQTYIPTKIILVDDNSTDNSTNIIKTYKSINSKHNIQLIKNKGIGKKIALKTAVETSKTEYCLFTDADCILPHTWIETYKDNINKTHADMYISAVKEIHNEKFINELQSIEFDSLQACTAAFCAIKKPIMCNGANMCVKRSVWQNMYKKNKLRNILSGDDVFMLHEIKKYKGHIEYINSSKAIVATKTPDSLSSFLKQRMRWGGKTIYYKDKDSISLAISVFILSLLITTETILTFFYSEFLLSLTILLALKITIDTTAIYNYRKIKQYKTSIITLCIFSILHPYYIVVSSIAGLFKTKKWK